MKRVLITGAAGFIGSHLAEYFLKHGAEVIGVDNYLTGSPKNIQLLQRHREFRFIEHDVCEPYTIDQPLDGVLHFASPASPPDFQRIPLETLFVSSYG
ncbi:MAG TPA: GDP-mannose 4,6-dehydratase, partial [bacterium]|nr:GDP-mannose 4,6-dehydratase [bacterium]